MERSSYILMEGHPEERLTLMKGSDGVFLLACEDFGRMFNHSFPTCAFFAVLKWRLACAYYFPSLARVSPQWLSKLRQLLHVSVFP